MTEMSNLLGKLLRLTYNTRLTGTDMKMPLSAVAEETSLHSSRLETFIGRSSREQLTELGALSYSLLNWVAFKAG